jgi:hypothetical protein
MEAKKEVSPTPPPPQKKKDRGMVILIEEKYIFVSIIFKVLLINKEKQNCKNYTHH